MAPLRSFLCRVTAVGISATPMPARSAALRSLRPMLRTALSKSRPFTISLPRHAAFKAKIPLEDVSKLPKSYIPEHLLIYWAGRNRLFFLSFIKITTTFLAAFFFLVVIPNEIYSPHPGYFRIATYAICGAVPWAFMAYASHPFIAYAFIRLPPSARVSRHHLERFIRSSPPPSTELRLITLNAFTRPRVSHTTFLELKPAKDPNGLVQWTRDVSRITAEQKWYKPRPVSRFGVACPNDKSVQDGWIWDAIQRYLGKTAKQRGIAE